MAIIPTSVVDFWFGLPDFVRRPIRTFVQAFVGIFAVVLVGVLANFQAAPEAVDLTQVGDVLVAGLVVAALAGAVAVASFVQNALEEVRGANR